MGEGASIGCSEWRRSGGDSSVSVICRRDLTTGRKSTGIIARRPSRRPERGDCRKSRRCESRPEGAPYKETGPLSWRKGAESSGATSDNKPTYLFSIQVKIIFQTTSVSETTNRKLLCAKQVSIFYILCSFTLVHLHWFIAPFHYSIGFVKRLISINSLCTSSIFIIIHTSFK